MTNTQFLTNKTVQFFAAGDSKYPKSSDVESGSVWRIFLYFVELAWFGIAGGAELAAIALAGLILLACLLSPLLLVSSLVIIALASLIIFGLNPGRPVSNINWTASIYLTSILLILQFVIKDEILFRYITNLTFYPGIIFFAIAPYSAFVMVRGIVFIFLARLATTSIPLKRYRVLYSGVVYSSSFLLIATSVLISLYILNSSLLTNGFLGQALSVTLIAFSYFAKIVPIKRIKFDQLLVWEKASQK